MKKIPIHFPLFIGGSLVILITGLIVSFFVLYPNTMVQSFVQSVQQRLGMQKLTQTGSKVNISASGGQLRMQFTVAEKDQEGAARFSQSLGVSGNWQKGIEVGLDDKTLTQLEPFLPLQADMSFEEKKIVLSSRSFSFLKSALPQSGTEFATGSGKLSFNGEGNNYHLKIEKPTDLLVYATSSGKLSLSKKINSVFSIGDKVATIELNLAGKNLDGEIVLR